MLRIAKYMLPALFAITGSAASAATVVGGNTVVEFGAAIAGLTPGLTGNATIVGAGPTVNFPITGGELDASLVGQIRHTGSGVTLSNGTNTVGLGNFIIDTSVSTLFGDVSLNGAALGTALPLFNFDLSTVTVAQLTDLTNPALALTITSTAANALTTAFGLPDTTGVTIGFAATAPQLAAVPEPATWALLIGGFAGTGIAMRRIRRPAVAA